MNSLPTWAQIVIAIFGSGTIGGIAGALSSSLAARQKIKELEVTYRQRLDENYRTNARLYMDTLIAATALERNLTLLTLDHDFERVPHLEWKLVNLKAA